VEDTISEMWVKCGRRIGLQSGKIYGIERLRLRLSVGFLYIYIYIYIYRGADKSLAQPTSRCILFDG